jgi:hypothetical protein
VLLLEVEHDRHRSPQLEVRVAVDEEGEAAHRVDVQVILLPGIEKMSIRYLLLFMEVFLTMERVANTYNANQIMPIGLRFLILLVGYKCESDTCCGLGK